MINIVAVFSIILSVVLLFLYFGKKWKIPEVIVLLSTTMVFAIPFVRENTILFFEKEISFLGDLGILCLMFLAGSHISKRNVIAEFDHAFVVALSSFITTLSLGFVVSLLIGFTYKESIMIGLCMSISAEATTTKVLIDMKKINTKLGALLLDAGVIDDALGVLALILISYLMSTNANHEMVLLLLSITFFATGMLIHAKIPHKAFHIFEKAVSLFLIPFFFISMALRFELQLNFNFVTTIIIVALAITGKILGVFIIKKWVHLNDAQAHLIGWGLNSRGAMGLVIATIGLKLSFIDSEIFYSIILMALITTFIFPFMIKRIIKQDPRVFEQ
jgi:Kef-type K+ transport system membrane component KefB